MLYLDHVVITGWHMSEAPKCLMVMLVLYTNIIRRKRSLSVNELITGCSVQAMIAASVTVFH